MKGFCRIIHKKSQRTMKEISYVLLYGARQEEQNRLLAPFYESYQRKEIEVFCGCGNVSLSVGKKSGTESYYLSTFPNQLTKHANTCMFRNGTPATHISVYQTAIKRESKDVTKVVLTGTDMKPVTKIPYSVSETKQKSSVATTSVQQHKLSVQQFTKWLLTTAWNELIMDYRLKKIEYPTMDMVFRKTFALSRKLYLLDAVCLADHFFSGSKIAQFHYIQKAPSQYPFVMGLLVKLDKVQEGYRILLKHPNGDEPVAFICSEELFEKARKSTDKVKDHQRFMTSGFILYKRGKPPEFFSLSLLPVSSCGLPVESSYECIFYEAIHQDKRCVQRPLHNPDHLAWGILVPDGVFIDTQTPTIVEVFGRSVADEEYHVRRRNKIGVYEALAGYDFYKWDAYAGEPMPDVPNKHI